MQSYTKYHYRAMRPASQLDLKSFQDRVSDRLSEEPVYRCVNASCLFRHDPLEKTVQLPETHILARVGGVLSKRQVTSWQLDLHEALDTTIPLPSWRPPRYGRACIVRARDLDPDFDTCREDDGLFDVKGTGIDESRSPKWDTEHNNGLVLLDEALREFTHYLIIEGLARARNAPFRCLPYFGVVDLGMRFAMPNRPALPACAIVRAPHFRPPRNNELPPHGSVQHLLKEHAEAWLNHYLLTSAHVGYQVRRGRNGIDLRYLGQPLNLSQAEILRLVHLGGFPVPFTNLLTNIQFCDPFSWSSKSAYLVDFMHYTLAEERVDCTAMTLVSDRIGNLGSSLPPLDLAFPPRLEKLMGRNVPRGDVLRPDQLKWISDFPGLARTKDAIHLFSLGLCHDFLHNLIDARGLFAEVRHRANECVELLLAYVEPV